MIGLVGRICRGLLLLASLACAPLLAAPRVTADLLLIDGNVIPMTGPGRTAQAIAVKDGRIVAVGRTADILPLRGPRSRVIDLAGRTVLPGFIDAHGHIMMLASNAGTANLSAPPVGGVTDIAALQRALRARAEAQPDGWLVGQGYDDGQLAEKRHPTRQELDEVSTDRPIFVWHVSGHLAVLNSKALAMLGILHGANNPAGGVIRREADGQTASGVLEEAAVMAVLPALPSPTLDDQIRDLGKAQRLYAANGLTTAQDGATIAARWPVLREASRRGQLFIDVHILPLLAMDWPSIDLLPFNAPYDRHLRVAGVKLGLDGSPQGRTAWLTRPYFRAPQGQDAAYAGYPQMADEALRARLAHAADRGWQVFVHVNGDAAIQQLIDGVRAVNRDRAVPMARTIAIHAQTSRPDQLRAMRQLDIEPSFFASHTFYWGDWHRDVVLGAERAEYISPQRDAFDAGLRPTIHNDAPIVPPDMIRLIWSAVTRRTRSGDILGAAQRVTPYEALMEVTSNAAYQIHEEELKGTLEPGKLADMVVLDADPLAVAAPDDLRAITVVATIKEGRTIFGSP